MSSLTTGSPISLSTVSLSTGVYRRRGIARTALDGALELVAQSGGGTVESYPQHTAGKKLSASFLYNATRSTFEHARFTYDGPKGKNHRIMRTTVSGRPDGLCGT